VAPLRIKKRSFTKVGSQKISSKRAKASVKISKVPIKNKLILISRLMKKIPYSLQES